VIGEGALRVALTVPTDDDAAVFVGLVKPELPGAYRLAGYLLRDAAEAEDAAQEAIAKAWESWPKLRERERFGAWFGRIVSNVCQDRLRKRRGVRVLEINDAVVADIHARDAFRDSLSRDEVGRLMRALPPDQQMVVALRFWRDLSLDEIAERLDLPLGTVKSRLHYAMRSLRQELDRQGKVSR
jgi:RNA polymerase sigma-70 factor (ECF subfamily)